MSDGIFVENGRTKFKKLANDLIRANRNSTSDFLLNYYNRLYWLDEDTAENEYKHRQSEMPMGFTKYESDRAGVFVGQKLILKTALGLSDEELPSAIDMLTQIANGGRKAVSPKEREIAKKINDLRDYFNGVLAHELAHVFTDDGFLLAVTGARTVKLPEIMKILRSEAGKIKEYESIPAEVKSKIKAVIEDEIKMKARLGSLNEKERKKLDSYFDLIFPDVPVGNVKHILMMHNIMVDIYIENALPTIIPLPDTDSKGKIIGEDDRAAYRKGLTATREMICPQKTYLSAIKIKGIDKKDFTSILFNIVAPYTDPRYEIPKGFNLRDTLTKLGYDDMFSAKVDVELAHTKVKNPTLYDVIDEIRALNSANKTIGDKLYVNKKEPYTYAERQQRNIGADYFTELFNKIIVGFAPNLRDRAEDIEKFKNEYARKLAEAIENIKEAAQKENDRSLKSKLNEVARELGKKSISASDAGSELDDVIDASKVSDTVELTKKAREILRDLEYEVSKENQQSTAMSNEDMLPPDRDESDAQPQNQQNNQNQQNSQPQNGQGQNSQNNQEQNSQNSKGQDSKSNQEQSQDNQGQSSQEQGKQEQGNQGQSGQEQNSQSGQEQNGQDNQVQDNQASQGQSGQGQSDQGQSDREQKGQAQKGKANSGASNENSQSDENFKNANSDSGVGKNGNKDNDLEDEEGNGGLDRNQNKTGNSKNSQDANDDISQREDNRTENSNSEENESGKKKTLGEELAQAMDRSTMNEKKSAEDLLNDLTSTHDTPDVKEKLEELAKKGEFDDVIEKIDEKIGKAAEKLRENPNTRNVTTKDLKDILSNKDSLDSGRQTYDKSEDKEFQKTIKDLPKKLSDAAADARDFCMEHMYPILKRAISEIESTLDAQRGAMREFDVHNGYRSFESAAIDTLMTGQTKTNMEKDYKTFLLNLNFVMDNSGSTRSNMTININGHDRTMSYFDFQKGMIAFLSEALSLRGVTINVWTFDNNGRTVKLYDETFYKNKMKEPDEAKKERAVKLSKLDSALGHLSNDTGTYQLPLLIEAVKQNIMEYLKFTVNPDSLKDPQKRELYEENGSKAASSCYVLSSDDTMACGNDDMAKMIAKVANVPGTNNLTAIHICDSASYDSKTLFRWLPVFDENGKPKYCGVIGESKEFKTKNHTEGAKLCANKIADSILLTVLNDINGLSIEQVTADRRREQKTNGLSR